MNNLKQNPSLLRKVPEITALFWIVKLLTTALGESTSDYLVARINPYAAVAMGSATFAVALFIQFRADRYKPWIYWLAVAMVAVFGTMAADAIHIQLGVPYLASTIFFMVALVIVFKTWHTSEKTLSIHSINSRRREIFYWTTVVTTFALGTAAGDLTAISFNLGYLSAGILFIGLILIPTLSYWKFRMNEVLTFWLAYILTRPLGASFADWMGKSKSVGGLSWGDLPVSAVITLGIVILVSYMTFNRKEAQSETKQQ
jgi:uncharacterized membrane-anchored protein